MIDILIDSARCQGHARCNAICPDVFDLDEEGFVVLLTPSVDDNQADVIDEAVDNCPEGAIKVQ
ncbi:ferredoxin [Mycobacterium intracellulare]|uniref:ferredoxin n=1 Tax=Mycobacterium intracellulare TaxID=1767 RepID=UPI001935D44A|nr:ferredoxin [Mycobacterium intracellulare]UEB24816.1 ferredoxin [Mycobacterium intracellulare]BCO60173.1 ferredoxin FdxD [Mycobacterium intracellulare]BCO70790.1 ferredoxin FdxD [Mycobacterium intracellulare]BCO76342.1 ferredoxin FdxD [Mycobacterium intracellulare]BCP18335.1 ferredoxin FdxD [Mycobacterium intracellulare]